MGQEEKVKREQYEILLTEEEAYKYQRMRRTVVRDGKTFVEWLMEEVDRYFARIDGGEAIVGDTTEFAAYMEAHHMMKLSRELLQHYRNKKLVEGYDYFRVKREGKRAEITYDFERSARTILALKARIGVRAMRAARMRGKVYHPPAVRGYEGGME